MYGEWANLIVMNIDAFAICGALSASNRFFSRSDLIGTIQSCLAGKATSTIQKRLSAMGRYAEWCTTHGRELFPLAEHAMYDYMLHLRNADTPVPTSGKSFLESVRFTCGVFGLGCDEFVRQSTGVTGLAEELARSGGVIRQAAPLTVLQVSKLEHHCRDLKSPCDRCLVGGVLALLYSSGRASDGTRTCTITWDMVDEELEGKVQGAPGYVELGVLASKGARTTKLRRMILPLAHLVSVSGSTVTHTAPRRSPS